MNLDSRKLARFAADLNALVPASARLGIAVSGGPDSLALLLLAHTARAGEIEAATVDHGLREGSAIEAAVVADLCAALQIPHATLTAQWPELPTAAIQSKAREERYRLLAEWAEAREINAVLTAHHADDQAETLLMRLARGAGSSGLAGIRATRPLGDRLLVRPLLSWRRVDLAEIVADAGIEPADDPSNRDPRFERSRARAFLADRDWPEIEQIAASASHLADAEEALRFATETLLAERATSGGAATLLDAADLPRELQRRLLVAAFARLGEAPPRGPDLDRALAILTGAGRCTLGGRMLTGGPNWRVEPVPPRRN